MRRLLLITLGAALSTPALATPVDTLVSSIAQRLAIADQVALTKWDSGKAVEDKPRERQVIDGATALAAQYTVPAEWAAQFFSAQIEANKLVQYAHLAEWTAAGKAPSTPRPDLVKDIRPALDTLQKTLLAQMAEAAPSRQAPSCSAEVAHAIAANAQDQLHRLALVRATAELCVTQR